jgi:hypothetical protein
MALGFVLQNEESARDRAASGAFGGVLGWEVGEALMVEK